MAQYGAGTTNNGDVVIKLYWLIKNGKVLEWSKGTVCKTVKSWVRIPPLPQK